MRRVNRKRLEVVSGPITGQTDGTFRIVNSAVESATDWKLNKPYISYYLKAVALGSDG